jgi:hypothetical protein
MNANIRPAIIHGRGLGILWPNAGDGHNVRAWADLLVLTRLASTAQYAPGFDLQVQRHGQRVGQLWNETLRYHKNHAYSHEVNQVRESTEWFVVHAPSL